LRIDPRGAAPQDAAGEIEAPAGGKEKGEVMRRILALAVLPALLLTLAAVALAAAPVKGAKYSGSLTIAKSETVSFKVSPSGKKVTHIQVLPYVPNRCGAGGPPPAQTSIPATIKNGKFKATLNEETSNGGISGTATVTGKFLAGGKVKGVVENPLPGAPECAGNFAYTAKASKG
jgi:hypothetical protein